MLRFYDQPSPKSLGYEWVEGAIFPLLKNPNISIEDKLRTSVEHIAVQISNHLPDGKTLITGGGAYNSFLIERLQNHVKKESSLVIPGNMLLEYKEAMIFGFLGVLRDRGEINCLKSVTGASCDSTGGVIYRK
jgi:anhydro-N-acetylmuramic acid kinase